MHDLSLVLAGITGFATLVVLTFWWAVIPDADFLRDFDALAVYLVTMITAKLASKRD